MIEGEFTIRASCIYLKPESRVHALCFDEAEAAGDDVVDGRIIR